MWEHHPGVILSTFIESGLSCSAVPYEDGQCPYECYHEHKNDASRAIVMNMPRTATSFLSLYIVRVELYTKMLLPDKKSQVQIYQLCEMQREDKGVSGPFFLNEYLNVENLIALLDKNKKLDILSEMKIQNKLGMETILACQPFRSTSEMDAFLDWMPTQVICKLFNCTADVSKNALRYFLEKHQKCEKEDEDHNIEENLACDGAEQLLLELLEDRMEDVEFWDVDALCLGEAATAIAKQLHVYAEKFTECSNVCVLYPYGFSNTVMQMSTIANEHKHLNLYAAHDDMQKPSVVLILDCFGDFENTINLVRTIKTHTCETNRYSCIFVGGRHIPIPYCIECDKVQHADTWLEHDFVSAVLACANAIKRGYPSGVGFPATATFENGDVRKFVCTKLAEEGNWSVAQLKSWDGGTRFSHTKASIGPSAIKEGVWMSKHAYPGLVVDFEHRSKKNDSVLLCNGDTALVHSVVYDNETGKRELVVKRVGGGMCYDKIDASHCPSVKCATPHFGAFHASIFF